MPLDEMSLGAMLRARRDRLDPAAIRHPEAGDITVDYDVLSDSDTDLKIVILTAVVGSGDEARLQFARVIGSGSIGLVADPGSSIVAVPSSTGPEIRARQ